MSDETYVPVLEAEVEFYRDRAQAWKATAKKYQALHAWVVANPGKALARLVLHANTHPEAVASNDVATVIATQACENLGWAFLEYLQGHPQAANYLEVTLVGENAEPLYVTIQRPKGKTPHQMRAAAEKELEALRNELDGVREQRDLLLAERDQIGCQP